MCGIAGILGSLEHSVTTNTIVQVSEAISHRGPDAGGYFEDANIKFGHKRLSIIDPFECSNQPMADHTGRYRIVFNGEIYNYRDLKPQLDYPFQTNGDTEVLLASFIKWGTGCLEKLRGMFAFAIWDSEKKQLFLARDRFGVKPLYYYHSNETFFFASEVRALLASGLIPGKINKAAISSFLQYQSVEGDATMVEGIKSLPAGSYMLVDEKEVHIEKYWSIVQHKPDFDYNNAEKVKKKIYELLLTSIERRIVSDVPIGVFLSGGVDSSVLVGLMAEVSKTQVNTFTVGFREKDFDESQYAQMVAKKFNTHHQQILLQPKTFLNELIPALDAMDSPSGDGVNSYVVSKAIRESGIKVALSGVGGDELFAGYPIFLQYLQLMKFKRIWRPFRRARHFMSDVISERNSRSERFSQLLRSPEADISSFYPAFRQIVSPAMLAECTYLPYDSITGNEELLKLNGEVRRLPLLSQVSVAEYLGYTQHTLLKDMDQMSMARSLEVREPYFDKDLVEFVLHIPDKLKYPSYPKKLLVESFNGLLPPEIIHRKKQGFLFPWKDWMKNELRIFCESQLNAISERDFIKGDRLMSYWKRFLNNDDSIRWMEIWLFVVLAYWLQRNNVG
ncbi:MAG: asparagine synthase (glutamine-hydrolyzing) [Chitinophagaceae bacterium]|nr:asparagine synthase (glutamine-hydrolyzing) [Chitinophagaceae bacterium]